MYDANGVLLYVGITADIPDRFHGHRDSKDWWSEIASIQLEHFPVRAAATMAEREAIKTERPKYNIIFNRKTKPRSMPNPENHTPVRPVRIPDHIWARFGEVAGDRRRSALINEFIAWYTGQPGAKMPKRPDPKTPREAAA